ncbi:MAG: hypothetical protein H7X94_08315 [Vallitaleaceae bacterium]|nr:hypothetical protein [Vallitaleaceae bacterium]
MNNVNTQLDLLNDILRKKLQYLQNILVYTKEQSDHLEKDDLDAVSALVQPKEDAIVKVSEIDDGFQTIYHNIRGIIEAQPALYKEKIETMKQTIMEIGDLGIAITVQEGRNKNQIDLAIKAGKNASKTPIQSKKTVTNYYSNMNKQKNTSNTSTIDFKK